MMVILVGLMRQWRTLGFGITGATLLSLAMFVSNAHAYTHWEWRAFEVRDSMGRLWHSGSWEKFPTKEQALAVFLADERPGLQVLTQSAGTGKAYPFGDIEYRFIAPPKAVTFTGVVRYYARREDASPAYGGGPHKSFPSEAQAIEAIVARENYYCYQVAEAVGDWLDNYGNANSERSWIEGIRTVVLRRNSLPNCITSPDPYEFGFHVFREQDVTCPAGYGSYQGAPTYPGALLECRNSFTAYVLGRPLECPAGSPSSQVGNPCNAATGDKSWTETDYVAPGLSFTRSYHSAVPASGEDLGSNWSHNYSSKLLFVTSTATRPTQLIRSSGYYETLSSASGIYRSTSGSETRVAKVGSEWIVRLSDGSSEAYSATGELKRIVDPYGRITTLYYATLNQRRRLSSIVGPFGHRIDFNSDTRGRIASVLTSNGSTVQYAYDAANNLRRVTHQDGTYREYEYEDPRFPDHLTGIIGEDGARLSTYAYDSFGRVTSSERAGQAGRIEIAYGTSTTSVTDPTGLVTTFTFAALADSSRRVTGIDRNGLTEQYQMETGPQRRVTRSTDARGNIKDFTYDADHLLSITEAVGTARARKTEYTYLSADDGLIVLERQSTAAGIEREIAMTYNAQRLPVSRSVSGPDGAGGTVSRTVTRTYTPQGQLQSIDGPRADISDVTQFTYHNCTTGFECGQVATITNALGHVTTFSAYDAHGRPLTVTDPNGVVRTFVYSPRGQLLSSTEAGKQTTFEYWPTGLVKKATLPDGSYLLYTYDAAHRLTEIADAHGNRQVFTLDAMGNHTAERLYDPANALRQTRTRVFNALNQLWKEAGAAGTTSVTTTYGYDNNGNEISIAAPLGRTTTQSYDELDRLVSRTDAFSGVTQYGYDALDQLISVTDPRSKVTTYTYNALGDLLQQLSPDTGTTTRTYDAAGNLQTKTDARAKTATYTYDALNRVTSVTYPDQTITYAYDGGTNQKGRLTQISDSSGSTVWTYDPEGRVLSRQQNMGVVKTLGYSYDSAGHLATLTLPSGSTITYGYTGGRVTSLTLNGATTILSNVLYQPFGPTRGWTWGNGTTATREYNADGWITSLASRGLKTYSYDDASRMTSITDVTNAALSQSFTYDLSDRLRSATGSSINQTWTYDSNGNRLTQGGSSNSTYTISAVSNRVTSVTGATSRTYTYDAAGNTVGDGAATFVYNAAGRMQSATKSSATTTYAINALGQRVRKTSGGTSTYFLYDQDGHLIGEYNGAGALVQETLWLGDIPVATLRPKTGGVDVFYVHTDHQNTPVKVSRPSDNRLRWRRDPAPFGAAVPNQNPESLGLFIYNVRAAGQYSDPETGLFYNYYRDGYDPATGRYTQSDPIGLMGGINTYAYAGNRPTLGIDPFGLFTMTTDVSWGMANNIGGWWNFGQLGGTNASVTTRCSCTQECGSWKLVECIGQFQIDVLIRNDLRSDVEKWVRSREQEHVDDLMAGAGRMRQAGAAAEAALRKQTFSSKESCEAQSQAAVQAALISVARQEWSLSKRRDSNGSHSYPGIWPYK